MSRRSSINDITGDKIRSKITTEEYRSNFERIFRQRIKDAEAPTSRHTSSTPDDFGDRESEVRSTDRTGAGDSTRSD